MNLEEARGAIAATQQTINAAIAELQAQLGDGVEIDVSPSYVTFNGVPGFEVVTRLRASA